MVSVGLAPNPKPVVVAGALEEPPKAEGVVAEVFAPKLPNGFCGAGVVLAELDPPNFVNTLLFEKRG